MSDIKKPSHDSGGSNHDDLQQRLVKRMRTLRMSDAEYEQCVMVAGPRNFTAWATKILLDAARAVPPTKGFVAGGQCSNAGCPNVGAWWLVIKRERYLCAHCAAPIERDFPWTIKDCRPHIVPQVREQLIGEIHNAIHALMEFDARTKGHTSADLVREAGDRPVPGMPTCSHGVFETCPNCRKTGAEKQAEFEALCAADDHNERGDE